MDVSTPKSSSLHEHNLLLDDNDCTGTPTTPVASATNTATEADLFMVAERGNVVNTVRAVIGRRRSVRRMHRSRKSNQSTNARNAESKHIPVSSPMGFM